MPQVQIWEVWLSPKKTSESQTISKIGIVTLGWNAVSKVNISEQEPPTTAEPPDQSLLQVRECLEKVKSCIEKHKSAAQTAKKNIVTWSDYMMFWGMLYASEKLQNLYMNRFINSQSFENPWPASELKPKNEKWSAWAILSGHSERGCGCCMKQLWHRWHIRGFWEIWACCQDLYIFFHIKMERSAAQHGWHLWCQNSYISQTIIAQKTFPNDLRFRAGCISMQRI